MSTSAADLNRRTGKRYLILTIFCCLFSGVYELFSHHVFSLWMISLPFVTLLLGVIPFFTLKKWIPDGWARQCWHCGVITFLVGNCLTGIFEIAGIHMPYTVYFLSAAGFLLLLGVCLLAMEGNKLRGHIKDV